MNEFKALIVLVLRRVKKDQIVSHFIMSGVEKWSDFRKSFQATEI